MLCAIYARKSTDQNGADADATSVARQVEGARAFAASRGWRVDDRHVYADDAVSGAETSKLRSRQRLLDMLDLCYRRFYGRPAKIIRHGIFGDEFARYTYRFMRFVGAVREIKEGRL